MGQQGLWRQLTDDLARACAELGEDPEIRALLTRVCDLTGMGFAALAFVSERQWIACQVEDRIDFGLDPGDELEIRKTICDDIRESGEAVIIDEIGVDPAWRTHPVPTIYGFESYASLPLFLADGSFYGTLCALDPEPRRLSARETVAALRAFADRIAALISTKVAAAARAG